MRISTSMIYEKGLASMQRQSSALLTTQQQVSSGRRILTPADDPIGAARALTVKQSQAVNNQFATNQGYADDNLKLLENRLVGVGDVLQYARERAVQAGNGTMTEDDLSYIAADMRAQFDALLALANSQDANGEYLFAGYKAQTKPFEGSIAGVTYAGDQGSRTMQVSASRFMPISLAGNEVFSNTRGIADSLYDFAAGTNTGTATLDVAYNPAVPDPANTGRRYDISYDATAGTYDVVEHVPGNPVPQPVLSGASGPTLSFNGLDVSVASGPPADGDSFEVMVASKDMFSNVALFVDALERPGAGGAAGAVAYALDNLDFALDNVLKVRAQVGSQMLEVENLEKIGSDLDLQYSQTLSGIEDVDYAEAITRLSRQQTFLQAAQQSYLKVTGLSLFNFL